MIKSFCILFFISSVGAASEVPFDFALREILSRHPDVRVQKTAVAAASTSSLSGKMSFLPNLSLSASEEKNEYSDRNNTYARTRSYLGTATINLFKSGADWSAMNAASANEDYQEAQLARISLLAEAESAQALLKLIEARKRKSVVEKNLKDMNSFLSIANERYRKGYLPMQEVEKIVIDVSNLDARLKNYESDLNSTREQVLRLWQKENLQLGWPWKERLNSSEVSDLLSKNVQTDSHPTTLTSLKRLRLAEEQAKTQFRLMLPSINLSYSYGRYETSNYEGPGWETLVTLKIPLFSGLQDYAQNKEKSEAKNAAEIQYEQEKINSLEDQKAAQDNFKIARTTALAREKTLEIAHRLLQATLARFKLGRADANDLNLDQARVYDSELLAHEGWKEAHLAMIRLYHAFGKSILKN